MACTATPCSTCTQEKEVHFADEGAKRVAFAPDTEMFECGLTGAELRYGVHPRQRQKRYAVERHEDRELLIGIRLAMLVPEKPYPDEKWFFGSEGSVIEGEWQPGAAEVIAARRKLLAMAACFPEDIAGKRPTRWQLALSNERMRVELTMINRHYRLTIGEHVKGDRTWAPSTATRYRDSLARGGDSTERGRDRAAPETQAAHSGLAAAATPAGPHRATRHIRPAARASRIRLAGAYRLRKRGERRLVPETP